MSSNTSLHSLHAVIYGGDDDFTKLKQRFSKPNVSGGIFPVLNEFENFLLVDYMFYKLSGEKAETNKKWKVQPHWESTFFSNMTFFLLKRKIFAKSAKILRRKV